MARASTGRGRKAAKKEESPPTSPPAASASTNAAPTTSKKQAREAARKRARESMAKDKAMVEATRKRKAVEEEDRPSDAADSASPSNTSKSRSNHKHRQQQQQPQDDVMPTPAKKRRRTMEPETATKVEASPPSPPPTTASKRRQSRQDAIQKAKEWAAQDKQFRKQQQQQKQQLAADSPSKPKSVPSQPTVTPSSSAAPTPTPVAPQSQAQSNTSMNPAVMAQFMMSQQKPQQQQQQQPPPTSVKSEQTAVYKAMVGYSHQAPPAVPSSAHLAPSKVHSKTEPNEANDDDDDDEDDEDMPPPPTSLEMQISKQVLANVSASMNNQPPPFTTPPPDAFLTSSAASTAQDDDDADDDDDDEHPLEEDDQPIIVDYDNDDMGVAFQNHQIYPPPSSATFYQDKHSQSSMVRIIGAIIAAVVGIYAWQMQEQDGIANILPFFHSTPVCFHDSLSRYVDGELLSPCPNGHATKCPEHGFCKDGILVECPHSSFQKDAHGKNCELTPRAVESMEKLRKKLEQLTIEEICNGDGTNFDLGQLPLFDYKALQLADPQNLAAGRLDHIVLMEEFSVESQDGSLFVGLENGHTISLPMECHLRRGLRAGLNAIGNLIMGMIRYVWKMIWSTIQAYPLFSFLGFLLLVLIQRMRSFQQKRTQLIMDVALMRDLAFAKLQEDPNTAHAALHIRDEIVSDVVITSAHDRWNGTKRLYWNTQVWPRVIPQIQQDNRIRKTQRVSANNNNNGTTTPSPVPREYWQWVASVRKAKRDTTTMLSVSNDDTTATTPTTTTRAP